MAIENQKLALYLVTDPALCAKFGLIETVKAAVVGGVSIVQLRDKNATTAQMIQHAKALQPILATHNVPLIINDDVEAAIACGADGIHVGQDDLDVVQVRHKVGPDKIVGLSVETAEAALIVDAGIVDYIGISPIFATQTKITKDDVDKIIKTHSVTIYLLNHLMFFYYKQLVTKSAKERYWDRICHSLRWLSIGRWYRDNTNSI